MPTTFANSKQNFFSWWGGGGGGEGGHGQFIKDNEQREISLAFSYTE